jgi:hypothetical protein
MKQFRDFAKRRTVCRMAMARAAAIAHAAHSFERTEWPHGFCWSRFWWRRFVAHGAHHRLTHLEVVSGKHSSLALQQSKFCRPKHFNSMHLNRAVHAFPKNVIEIGPK